MKRSIGAHLADQLFGFERSASRGDRIFLRVFELFIVGWTLQFAWTWFATLQRLEAVVLPLGLANYVDVSVFFAPTPALVLTVALTVSLALGVFRKGRFAYAVALVLFHLAYVSRYSLGEISHGSHFIGMAVLGLAIGTAAFHEHEEAVGKFSVGFAYFLYGIGYTSASLCKLIGSGIGWPKGDHFALWVGERSVDVMSTFGTFELNVLQDFSLRFPILGTAALTFGLLAEIAGVLMWFRKLRMWVMTALIAMHVGVELSLNIYFGHNIYVLVLLAYPWGRWLDRFLPPRSDA
ncbi:MAG: hypothetical protein AAGA54_09790 [Myxococcota bacterium]